MRDSVIYHITNEERWEIQGADYRTESLETEGFIHCSTRAQVPGSVARYFEGVYQLVLLEIDPSRVSAEVKWEESRPSEWFPHIYGPLNLPAIVATHKLTRQSDGFFSWPWSS